MRAWWKTYRHNVYMNFWFVLVLWAMTTLVLDILAGNIVGAVWHTYCTAIFMWMTVRFAKIVYAEQEAS